MCKKCLFCEKIEGALYKINSLDMVCFEEEYYLVEENNKEYSLEFYLNSILDKIISLNSFGVCVLCINDFQKFLFKSLLLECDNEKIEILSIYIELNVNFENFHCDEFYNEFTLMRLFEFLDENCQDKYTIIRQLLRVEVPYYSHCTDNWTEHEKLNISEDGKKTYEELVAEVNDETQGFNDNKL